MNNNSVLTKHDSSAAGIETGFCTLCEKKTEYKCDRCGDFYCTQFCQRKDWPNHRYICFPMPKLVKAGQCTFSNEVEPQSSINTTMPPNGSYVTRENNVREEPQLLKSSVNSNMPPSGSCVTLTGFKSSNRCSILSTNPSIVAEYQKVLNEINEFGKNSAALKHDPRTNSHALASFGDKWCRVEILANVKHGNFRIFFIDYGHESKRFLKELRHITPNLVNLPCFNHIVQLHGVRKVFNEAVLQSLSKYVNKEYKVQFVQPDEKRGNVKLFQWGSNVLLNSLIQNLSLSNDDEVQRNGLEKSGMNKNVESKTTKENIGTTETNVSESLHIENPSTSKKPSTSPGNNLKKSGLNENFETKTNSKENDFKDTTENNSSKNLHTVIPAIMSKKPSGAPRQIQIQKPCLQPPFEIIPLGENDSNCKLIIVDNSYIGSGYIGCLLEKYLENLNAVLKFLGSYNVGDQSYKPKINEYCLAKYEDEWYRAKVMEIISDDKFLVVYIDFTNEMELTSKSIRHYPMSLTLPCCTTLCGIDGLPEDISDELKNFLELNCEIFKHLNIESIRTVDEFPYVKSTELLNKMRNSKLL